MQCTRERRGNMYKEMKERVEATLKSYCEAHDMVFNSFKAQSKTFYFKMDAHHPSPTKPIDKHIMAPFKATISSLVLDAYGIVSLHCHLRYDYVDAFLDYYREHPPGY